MTPPRSKARSKSMPTKAEREKREKGIVVDLKAGKLSYRQIAKKHGVSLPTVNNKARKFGISRGRREGAKILVPMPPRKKAGAGAAKKKTAKRAVRKAARKTTRKAARKTTTRKTTRKTARRATPRTRVVRRGAGFQDALRELILKHYPNISLRSFDRLTAAVEKALG